MYKYLNSPSLKYVLGLIELLLIIAFVLKIMAAGAEAPFVRGLYAVTDSFAAPFKGMFRDTLLKSGGMADMATFSGIIIYAIFVIIPIFLHQKYQKTRPIAVSHTTPSPGFQAEPHSRSNDRHDSLSPN